MMVPDSVMLGCLVRTMPLHAMVISPHRLQRSVRRIGKREGGEQAEQKQRHNSLHKILFSAGPCP
jgi:hypothetical protein